MECLNGYTSPHYCHYHLSSLQENVAAPGLGLLGLKTKLGAAKFKTDMGLLKLGAKGASKMFHAGALLGSANPNEFDDDDSVMGSV